MHSREKSVLHQYIKRFQLKRSKRRDLILEVFLNTRRHVSNEELYLLVKQRDPSIGLTTVYRTLKLLKECGLARELQSYEGVILYEHDYKADHHDHLICTVCGGVLEFFSRDIEKAQEKIVRKYKFKPLHHSHRIFGVCEKCQNRTVPEDERLQSKTISIKQTTHS